MFRAHVNIFVLSEIKIVETYRRLSNAIFGLLDDLRADLGPVKNRSHTMSGSLQHISAVSASVSHSFWCAGPRVERFVTQDWRVYLVPKHTQDVVNETKHSI